MAPNDLIDCDTKQSPENAMNAQMILRKFIDNAAPQMHSARRESLIGAVTSALDGATLGVTALGRELRACGVYEKHRIKRVDRLLSNRHLYRERMGLYEVVAQRVLGSTLRPIISVDWSDLDRGKTRYLLRASVALDGRAFTLYEEVHPRDGFQKRNVERAFLKRLAKIVEPHRCPIIITDAGFHNPWTREVIALGWDYICRVRGRVMLATHDEDWERARDLFAQATFKPTRLDKVRLSQHTPLSCEFVLFKQRLRGRHHLTGAGQRVKGHASNEKARSQREPWLLATSLDLSEPDAIKRVVRAYKTRMQIEEAFRDLKSARFGLGFEASQAKLIERVEILFLFALLAMYVLWLIGLVVEVAKHQYRYQANTERRRRTLSTVFLARRAWRDRAFSATLDQLIQALQCIHLTIEDHADGF